MNLIGYRNKSFSILAVPEQIVNFFNKYSLATATVRRVPSVGKKCTKHYAWKWVEKEYLKGFKKIANVPTHYAIKKFNFKYDLQPLCLFFTLQVNYIGRYWNRTISITNNIDSRQT